MKDSLPEAQNIWKPILAIVAGTLLMWDSCSLKGALPNASLTEVLLRFLVFTITWLGGFFSLARTKWRIAIGAIGLSCLFPVIALFSSDNRVSLSSAGEWLWILSYIGAGAAILKRYKWGRILYISIEVVFISWGYYSFTILGPNDAHLGLKVAFMLHLIFFPIVAVWFLMRTSTAAYFNRTSEPSSAIAR